MLPAHPRLFSFFFSFSFSFFFLTHCTYKAVSKSGQRFGGKIMVGVAPCRDESFLRGAAPGNGPIYTPGGAASAALSPRGTPNRPRELRSGMAARENPAAPVPPTPQKSVVQVLREYALGW